MKIIAITAPGVYDREPERITSLLRSGEADYVHIRKPEWSEERVEKLILSIPEDLHHLLKLHDHHVLAEKYRLGGIHLNSRNPEIPESLKRKGFEVSKSCHSIKELIDIQEYDYVTLSPIFDSISKKGYISNFALEEINNTLKDKRVVALGGVTPDKLEMLKETGFYGAAMLGYFFPSNSNYSSAVPL